MSKLLIVLISLMISMGISLADPWESFGDSAYSRSNIVIGPGNDFTASDDGTSTFPNGLTISSGKELTGGVNLNDSSLENGANGLGIGIGKFSMDVLAGGAAGNHTLTGIDVGDELIGVAYFANGGENLTSVSDLTGEFAISDANVIENSGNTSTVDGFLLVNWLDRT